jgi:hypothetical protein
MWCDDINPAFTLKGQRAECESEEKRMKTKLALLATTALAALAIATPANAAGSGWYVSVTGGAGCEE